MASEIGHDRVVSRLLEAGADVSQVDKGGYSTALIRVSYNGHEGVVSLLLEAIRDISEVQGVFASMCTYEF